MTLEAIKTECEKDESRMEGAHAKVDKLTDGGTISRPPMKPKGVSVGKAVMMVAIAVILIGAAFYILRGSDQSSDVQDGYVPVIDSQAFANGPNGMRAWINASDTDDTISNITVCIFVKSQDNTSYMGTPIFTKVYWINETSANITDILNLGDLPPGNYGITSYAIDSFGHTSKSVERVEFALP